MKEGDLLITALRQVDGTVKNRPVVFLRRMPPFQDFLVCGISTQLQQSAPELDETITPSDPDFSTSGLKSPSLIPWGISPSFRVRSSRDESAALDLRD